MNLHSGEVMTPRPRTPHAFDGKGYTLESIGSEVPLYALGLTGTQWALLDWVREHGGASAPVRLKPADVAPEIHSTEGTVKSSLSRLVALNLLLKTSPRSAAYQLTPRRYWEGSGSTQVTACRRIDPPAVAPDAKARTKPRSGETS
ncbi:helix-turn-helix domain-containing protein [Streptomyces sp. H10-C2]|uniref:MarR family transcriptional regulator n=1 Tax=Streptomyces sp. PH10-H1 TaxID=3046212 RepID=UPI0024BB40DF|nr:helix-turn-helix domain-containing protein [Streptomyces sp. PH10-H1]MDJ0346699.1 helix-turn-helix domain-containing protein [Streptomyces sp. PH10-H1]MDJ0374607.1 helix-turn-helix domain-containing protein [Streptomyces sp. H10-C2]